MKIVIYKFKNKEWRMTRAGVRNGEFFTAVRSPTLFKDGRSARGFARSAARFARKELGWKRVIFDVSAYRGGLQSIADKGKEGV